MPGHVLSLTAGAAAYESKCALKISFSSRDQADKELARARTSYGISYVASIYLISWRLPFSLLYPCLLSAAFLFLFSRTDEPSLRAAMHVASRIHPPLAIVSTRHRRAGSRGINDGILYVVLVPTSISPIIRKHSTFKVHCYSVRCYSANCNSNGDVVCDKHSRPIISRC